LVSKQKSYTSHPPFAVAVTGLLHTGEGQVGLGADGLGVHVRDPVVEILHRPERRVHVPRVDRAGESVHHVVVHPDRLIQVLDLDDGG